MTNTKAHRHFIDMMHHYLLRIEKEQGFLPAGAPVAPGRFNLEAMLDHFACGAAMFDEAEMAHSAYNMNCASKALIISSYRMPPIQDFTLFLSFQSMREYAKSALGDYSPLMLHEVVERTLDAEHYFAGIELTPDERERKTRDAIAWVEFHAQMGRAAFPPNEDVDKEASDHHVQPSNPESGNRHTQ